MSVREGGGTREGTRGSAEEREATSREDRDRGRKRGNKRDWEGWEE